MCLKSITDFLSLEYPEVLIRKKKMVRKFQRTDSMERFAEPYLWGPQYNAKMISLVLLILHPYHLGRTLIEIYTQLILMMKSLTLRNEGKPGEERKIVLWQTFNLVTFRLVWS